jgi:hypothetical protein
MVQNTALVKHQAMVYEYEVKNPETWTEAYLHVRYLQNQVT